MVKKFTFDDENENFPENVIEDKKKQTQHSSHISQEKSIIEKSMSTHDSYSHQPNKQINTPKTKKSLESAIEQDDPLQKHTSSKPQKKIKKKTKKKTKKKIRRPKKVIKKQKKSSWLKRIIMFFFFLVIMAALCIGGYMAYHYYWHQEKQINDLQQQIQDHQPSQNDPHQSNDSQDTSQDSKTPSKKPQDSNNSQDSSSPQQPPDNETDNTQENSSLPQNNINTNSHE